MNWYQWLHWYSILKQILPATNFRGQALLSSSSTRFLLFKIFGAKQSQKSWSLAIFGDFLAHDYVNLAVNVQWLNIDTKI